MGKRRGIRVAPQVVILTVGMLLTDRSGVCFLTLAAALLHECGHLMAARLLKIPLGQVKLDFLGARLEITGRMLSYGEEWLLCVSGPLISLFGAALAAIFWTVCSGARIFSCASLLLGLLNLLPIRTFDGGRMLEVVLSRWTGPHVTEICMNFCSLLFLFLLWATAVYFLLRAGDGISLLCFSMSLLLRGSPLSAGDDGS